MIKVVIAEDKPLILRSLKEKILKYSPSLMVVGEAMNGSEALVLIEANRPDLVFTDIRMPVMDGLQMIEKAKIQNMDTEFIIISGHDEFDYARQAMKLGVKEYLLKPVESDEINRFLDRWTSDYEVNKRGKERNALQTVINSSGKDSVNANVLPDYPTYLILIIQAGPYSKFIIDYSNPFNGYWSTVNISERLNPLLGKDEECWSLEGKAFNEQVIVLGVRNHDEQRLRLLTSNLKQFFAESSTPITVAISEPINDAESLGIKSQILRATLRRYSVFAKSSVLLEKDWSLFGEKDTPLLDPSLEKKLILLLRGDKKEHFLHAVTSLLQLWESRSFSQFDVEHCIKQLLRICQQAVHGMVPISGNIELEADEIISISKDYHSLFQGLHYIFESFFSKSEQHKQRGNHQTSELVRKVESYINENYQSQLTIHDIAKMVNFHPGYLSKVFKNIVGASPMEYLTNLRIQKAKELMTTDPHLSLRDIAESVGYSNAFYFSRIFKVATGKSPSEFKQD
jgi:two-component system, response regulator YesN